MPQPQPIGRRLYAPADNGLGDHWAAMNWCLQRSIATGQEVFLSDRPVMQWHPDKFRPGRLSSIRALLSHPLASVHLVDDVATDQLDPEEIWQVPYLPTHSQWRANTSGRICYQSDPATIRDNVMSIAEERIFVDALQRRGFSAFRLGSHIPLEECVRILSASEALICTSSGFAHVAHSVGTPLFLVQGAADLGYLIKHHVGKRYVLCKTYLQSVDSLRLERECLQQ
jgi:hypothetical protein